jgi:hypothetical protein
MMCTLAVAGPEALWAQSGGTDPLRDLRGKADLTAADLSAIDQHLQSQIATVLSSPDDARTIRRFQERLTNDYSHSGNSAVFKQRFAERCGAMFAEKIKSSTGDVSGVLLHGLGSIGDPAALPALKEAANSATPGTRALAVLTLSRMAPAIEANPAVLSDVISWLEQVGSRDQDDIVAELVYGALRFASQRTEQSAALARILEARLSNYENNAVTGYNADISALARVQDLSGAFSDADKKRVVGSLAKYLAYYTHRYVYGDLSPSGRGHLHVLVHMTEGSLTQLAGLPVNTSSVAGAIGSADEDRYAKIRAALEAWVGSPNKTGRLNGGTWQVAVGAVPGLDFTAPVPEHPDDPTPDE